MEITKEQLDIMNHTATRAVGGFYCGDSKDMKALVELGLMMSAGKKAFVPDEYFCLTIKGKEYLKQYK